MKEIKGNLISLALAGEFDVIAHGCNCFCKMKSGIAIQMAEVFHCDTFTFEGEQYKGDINKLGLIQSQGYSIKNRTPGATSRFDADLVVVNCYTQYRYGVDKVHLDYEALTLCMRKINHLYKGKHIGLPWIGSGLAGGIWDFSEYNNSSELKPYIKDIKTIIQEELKDCKLTLVEYDGS